MNKEKNINSQRERIDKLRENDAPDENSIEELAHEEEKYRNLLKKHGQYNNGGVNKLADKYSNQVLEKIENRQEIMIDELTGVWNKRFIEEIIPKLLDQEKRKNQNCSFLMFDIDKFKKINDDLGHDDGDELLKSTVKIIKNVIRNSDYMCRFGGDEFTLFLPDTDTKQAEILAERIRQAVEQAKINDITISLGCASTSELEDWQKEQKFLDMEKIKKDLIKRADKALYVAKNNGRNQVAAYKNGKD